ncbi:hypothetical protein LTR48_000096 [Friedmanniomyces endolithicus]|nr:hypothetical protein LTR29_005118 [Friedmanniomyces endolithicus]KAK1094547.1 hypothetical protein LTR48_000096 [Friedmanniomyces endolithicus]
MHVHTSDSQSGPRSTSSVMPPPSSRMTKNREQPTRYRPGKAEVDEIESEDESDASEDEDADDAAPKAPAPKASSFPSQKKLAVDLSRAGQQVSFAPAPKKPLEDELEGFVTASESSDEEDVAKGSSDEDDDSSEEEESSDDEPKKPMIRPTFISKAKRTQQNLTTTSKSSETLAAEEEAIRKAKADELLQAQLERDAAARAAGRKAWDDDAANIDPEDEVDDTDDVDPEAERASWKLRELKRVRRDRLAIEEKEKQREEIERRRNMTAEEREAEDREFIAKQEGEREGKEKMGFMQKYYHKGAFFSAASDGDGEEQDEEVRAVMTRDLAGAKVADEAGDKSGLPEYMRIRDMTQLGRKGRSKYKDLRGEDTGRWGVDVGRRSGPGGEGLDERFRPDGARQGQMEQTGANTQPVGERRRREDEGDRQRDDKRARYG